MKSADASKFLKAAHEGDLKTVTRFLADLHPKEDKETLGSALNQAVDGRHPEIVDCLLKAGANPNHTNTFSSVLIKAACVGDLAIVKRLIDAGANYHKIVEQESALSGALCCGQFAVADYLEELGAKVSPERRLFYACEQGNVGRAERALAAGADIEKPGGLYEGTPLMVAARKNHLEIVKCLLQHGANPNRRVKDSMALHDAVRHGKNVDVFNALVAAGADVNAVCCGETVLMAAASGGCLPIVKRLVELGAEVQRRDKGYGKTALDHAQTRKNKDVVAYLSGLGATSDIDPVRVLMRAAAKEFGGRPEEYVNGILLKTKLAGNRCQFFAQFSQQPHNSVAVFKVKYDAPEFCGLAFPMFEVYLRTPKEVAPELCKAALASKAVGLAVHSSIPKDDIARQEALAALCSRLADPLKQLQVTDQHGFHVDNNGVAFRWSGTDFALVRPRLLAFAALVQTLARPPQPERVLFEGDWLLKPAPKGVVGAHALGGALAAPVACVHCGAGSNLMARLDLADPALPETALGRGTLPVFWCLGCGEWDPTFFDFSGEVPTPLSAAGATATGKDLGLGEADLPEKRVVLVPVPAGKKAGPKSKIGGTPSWIQSEEKPTCPKCGKEMAFVLQLASDARISFCDMGMLYAFACPECRVTASLIQSH